MTYTPGPWFLNDDCIEAAGPEGPRDVTVAVVYSPADQRAANARLIANAPRLVDLLEDCADWVGRYADCKAADQCVDSARMLLAYVKGGTNG